MNTRPIFEGASGGMEPIVVLHVVIDVSCSQKLIMKTLVTDDDSFIKAKLKWSNDDRMAKHGLTRIPWTINKNGNEVPRPDKEELPADTKEPNFLADPSHMKKSLKN